MKLKGIASLAFLFNTALFATYYAVSKEALARIDPIVFTFFEMVSLVPVALCILVFSWRQVTQAVVRRGIVLGSSLCLALFTIAIALKYTSATSTAFFPALNGFLAALIAWLFLKQPLTRATWGAGLLSIVGAVLLIINSPMGGVRGSLIAFLGGLFFTCYVFLSEHEQQHETSHWPLFAIELLTMAGWACLVSLLFGDWQAFHPSLPKDVYVIIYVASACTFLPTLITVLMQKHISPLTVSFIYVMEPVLGAAMATFYLHEVLPLYGYLGGGLVVIGAIIQICSGIKRPQTQEHYAFAPKPRKVLKGENQRWGAESLQGDAPTIYAVIPNGVRQDGRGVSLLGAVVYPLVFLFGGGFLLAKVGGVPPLAWQELFAMHVRLTALWHQTAIQLLIVQALCWLVAWISVILIGSIGVARGLSRRTLTTEIDEQATMEHLALPNVPANAQASARSVVRQTSAEDLLAVENVLQHTFAGDLLASRAEVRTTDELPTRPEIQVWEEYEDIELAVASYEIPTVPPINVQGKEPLPEQHPRVRRLRLARA